MIEMYEFPLPSACPACQNRLNVARLTCSECGTAVEGRFIPGKLASLPREHQEFIEVFIRYRGNIREVEKALGVSYPTVRGRLEAAIEALGYPVASEVQPESSVKTIERLASGEITVEQALRALQRSK